MYRPPFRQELPHIAAGIVADRLAEPAVIGAPTKACALLTPKPTVSSIAEANDTNVPVLIRSPSWLQSPPLEHIRLRVCRPYENQQDGSVHGAITTLAHFYSELTVLIAANGSYIL